jgi:pyruvate dehydrogenase E2 component (dihydrolipoamide acetyltransferase)
MASVIKMPKLGFDMAEGVLVRWVIAEGEPVKRDAVVAEIETDKATVEVESIYEGVMARHLAPAGEVVPVNTPIAVIAAAGEQVDYAALGLESTAAVAAPAAPAAPVTAAPAGQTAPLAAPPDAFGMPANVKASPLARRMARDMRINLQQVGGSGPAGRIVKRDIEAYLAAPAAQAAQAAPASPAAALVAAAEDQVLPLNRLRAAIARRMTEAKQQTPHFYVTHEYDVEALLALRKQVNALLPEDEKLSVNDFIVKAAALALRQFPNLNASFQGEQVLRHGQVNVGVAVAIEGGLLTIVSRATDLKPLRQISSELRSMVARARDGKVRPDDIEGSTFSISNLGMFDVEHFIAIINPPEAAILAVGSAKEAPVVKNGQIVPGMRMKATISVDHRVSDGVEAAQFLQALARLIEEPLRLLV